MFNEHHPILDLPYRHTGHDSPEAILGFFKGNFFLSNFYPRPYEIDGIEFHSSEQGYMWEKDTRETYRRNVMRAATPRACKKVGYTANLPSDWDELRRYQAMWKHIDAKFNDPYMRDRLLYTDNAYLEETNQHGDTHWGVDGIGDNHLGILLMCKRFQLQKKLRRVR